MSPSELATAPARPGSGAGGCRLRPGLARDVPCPSSDVWGHGPLGSHPRRQSPDHPGFARPGTFDEMYSAMAVQGLDADGDGVYSAGRAQAAHRGEYQFAERGFDYFTFVHVGDADALTLKPPENASLDYDKVCSRFTSPCRSINCSTRMIRRFKSTSTIRLSSSPSALPPKHR